MVILLSGTDESVRNWSHDWIQRNLIYAQIDVERARQITKWGHQSHDEPWWYVILGEEFGEVGRAIFEADNENLEAEIIQVMAVCVAWLEDWYARTGQGKYNLNR